MFRKFLFFTGLLLTIASQSGYALTLEPPKAVLQRGNYSKITLNFVINNITASDISTYDMGRLETDDGIRSLTRYLDICINETSGIKCAAGLTPKKVTYLTNTELDTTLKAERDEYLVASFSNGSPRFSLPQDAVNNDYRRLEVTMDIIASGDRKFSTSNYVALRLLPGNQTSSSTFQDVEVKPTLAVVVTDVVESFEIRSSKGTLTAIWNTNEQLDKADGTQSLPDGAIAFYVEKDNWGTQNIPLHTYNKDAPDQEQTLKDACLIVRDGESNNCTLSCPGATGADDYYLKVDDLKAANFDVLESGNTGNISFASLDNEKEYALVLQNQPDGLRRTCKIAKPSDAVTLTELGGGPEPQVKDPRCFIATAAYGSPLDPHLNTLRWFRDHVLMMTNFGNELVQIYYRLSPPLAGFIAQHPTLRTVTRGALWLPVIIIEFWRERPSLLLTLAAMSGAFLLLFLRRRSLRASV